METKWDGRRMDTVNCVIVRLIMAAFKCKSGEGGLGGWGGGGEARGGLFLHQVKWLPLKRA